MPYYGFLDRAPKGRDEDEGWQLWIRRHDEYGSRVRASEVMSAQGHDMDQRLLLACAQAGDERAFRRLVEPYRHALEVHCYRMLGSAQDAEDLAQETLLRAWRALERFEPRAQFQTWLYRIATNACLDELERRPRRPDAGRPVPRPAVGRGRLTDV